ncbi:MAG: hypothetical protein IJU98_09785 [Synergistaceae bacterium]|nr:hypothetical protein [Synergistaceae bacterium]
MNQSIRHGVSPLTDYDIFLFKQGTHYSLYDKMGAQPFKDKDGTEGVAFSVWAPNAQEVSVIGNFNGWDPGAHPLAPRWDGSGIWEGFIPGLKNGSSINSTSATAVASGRTRWILSPGCSSFRRARRPSSTGRSISGATASGWHGVTTRSRCPHPGPFTRSTWAPGAGAGTMGSPSPTARWPRSCRTTAMTWASPPWSSCP